MTLEDRFYEVVRPATIIKADRLNELLGIDLLLVSETFQQTGSFKFRAAFNVALKIPQERLIAASSGNFGQALALACKIVGKSLTVVMPFTSARVKIDAVRSYGAQVDLIDVHTTSRAQRLKELAEIYPEARCVSAYDDDLVIEGNSSLGLELGKLYPSELDYVVVPVGGGGLISGVVRGLEASGCRSKDGTKVQVIGAEPALGNDAARSLKAGELIANTEEPPTIADGARTVSLGQRNWEIIREAVTDIIEVPEENIRLGLRQLFLLANLKVEPTGALAWSALLTDRERFLGRKVALVLSGGNVDTSAFCQILENS